MHFTNCKIICPFNCSCTEPLLLAVVWSCSTEANQILVLIYPSLKFVHDTSSTGREVTISIDESDVKLVTAGDGNWKLGKRFYVFCSTTPTITENCYEYIDI